MKAIFINTESSIRNESHRFRLTLADKLKNSNKNMVWANLRNEKILSLQITTLNLKSLLQRGMMNLIWVMDYILFQTFKIILSTLLKNIELKQTILLCKLTRIKSKTGLFLK